MIDQSLEQRLIESTDNEDISKTLGEEGTTEAEEQRDSLRNEFWELMKISFPVGIATLARLAIYCTDTAYLGHLGDAQLTAATLVDVIKDIASNMSFGFAYVLNQVCAQAIGSGNPKLAGNWLQLCLAFCTLSAIPVVVIFYYGGNILAWFNDDEDVLKNAKVYGHYGCMIFLPVMIYCCLRQFFQAAQIVIPATIVSLLTIGVNIALNQLLVFGFAGFGGWGMKGSPIATVLSMFFQISVFMSIMLYKGYFLEYWDGWSWSSFRKDRVVKLLGLVLPLTLNNFVETGGWQVITIGTSKLGEVQVAAMSILYTTWGILWAFYWGFGLALQVRVGFHLGKGNLKLLRMTLNAALVSFFFLISSLAAGCYFLRWEIGQIFNEDPEVLEVVAKTMPFLSLNYFVGCLGLAGQNVLEGMSRNKVVFFVSATGMWAICIPLFFYLTFHCPYFLEHGQLQGAWTANAVSELFKCVAIWITIFRSDLEKLSMEARERSEAEKVDVKEEKDTADNIEDIITQSILSPRYPTLQSPG